LNTWLLLVVVAAHHIMAAVEVLVGYCPVHPLFLQVLHIQ
jgi:hypothetical protein